MTRYSQGYAVGVAAGLALRREVVVALVQLMPAQERGRAPVVLRALESEAREWESVVEREAS